MNHSKSYRAFFHDTAIAIIVFVLGLGLMLSVRAQSSKTQAPAIAADTPCDPGPVPEPYLPVVAQAGIPGVSPSQPLFSPGPFNKRLWHITFKRVGPEVNEALVGGREHIHFSAEYAGSAGTHLPDDVLRPA